MPLELLPDDDPDLVRPLDAARRTGLSGTEVYDAIFAGRVRGGPDRQGVVRVSLRGLRALRSGADVAGIR